MNSSTTQWSVCSAFISLGSIFRLLTLSAFLWLSPVAKPMPVVEYTPIKDPAPYPAFFERRSKSRYLSVAKRLHLEAKKARLTERRVFYVANQNDVEAFGSETFTYTQAVVKVTIDKAFVVSPYGTAISVAKEALSSRAFGEYTTFSPQQEAVVQYFPLQPGDRLVLEFTQHFDLKAMEAGWAFLFMLGSDFDVDEWTFHGTWSTEFSPHLSKNIDSIHCDRQQGRAPSLTCASSGGIRASERGVGHSRFFSITEAKSWAEFIPSYLDVFFSALSPQSEAIDALATIIKRQHASLEDQITQAQKIVTKDIQYLSGYNDDSFLKPNQTAETLENKVGNCKDKTALLVDLLSRLGVQAHPVLVHTKRQHLQGKSPPAPAWFDHLIACFEVKGDYRCIDATAPATPWTAMPPQLQGRLALNFGLRKHAKVAQLTLIPRDQYVWKKKSLGALELDSEGGFIETTDIIYEGHYGDSYRQAHSEFSSEAILEQLVLLYQSQVSASAQPEVSYEPLPGQRSYRVRFQTPYTGVIDPSDDLYFKDSHDWFKYELNNVLVTKNQEIAYLNGVQVQDRREYRLGPLWTLSYLPLSFDLQSEFGVFQRRVTHTDEGVEVELKLAIPSQTLQGRALDRYRQFINSVQENLDITLRGQLRAL